MRQNPPSLLTYSEVAELLRVPVSTVRLWRHRGTGPEGFRAGRRVLFREDAVRAWIEARERDERRTRSTKS